MNPPELRPSGTRHSNGHSHLGISNAELGALVEDALALHMGFELAHPSRPQGPFDLLRGRNAYEVKALTTGCQEYKVKSSRRAVERKRAFAALHNLIPHTLIAVVDSGVVHAYCREGLGAFRLNPTTWDYLGSVPVTLP